MCDLVEKFDANEFIGYKVVIEIEGKNYSPAMGFCYDDYDTIPVIKEQFKLTTYFNDDILNKNVKYGYKENMIGRTAIFKNISDAYALANYFRREPVFKGKIKVKKAKVTIDLLIGFYGTAEEEVIGGRKIEFF